MAEEKLEINHIMILEYIKGFEVTFNENFPYLY